LLDLETRDLSEMKTVSGITVVFDPQENMAIRCPVRHPPKRLNNEHRHLSGRRSDETPSLLDA
jgi:hypothetical protein